MIKETVYTTIGAAALAADFVTSPTRQQNWLKKAERRGGKLAQSTRLQVRPVQKQIESAVEDVLGLIGLAEQRTEKAASSARTTARRTATRPRRSTPRVSATSRRTRARRAGATRPVRQTTVSLQTPAAQAS